MPTLVWGAEGLFVLLLLLSAQLFPSYRGPDETHHVDLVHALADGERYPPPDVRNIGRGVLVTKNIVDFFDKSRNLEAQDAPPRHERPSISEAGGSEPSEQYNQASQHPPLYYALAGAWLRGWRAVGLADGFDQTVGVLRLLSVLFVAPLPLLAWATARRLGAPPDATVAAAFVPVALPQLVHIGSVVNNDGLLIGLFALLTYLVARLLRGDRSRATSMAIGLVAAAALLTKALALVLLPWLVFVYAVVWWRSRREWRVILARAVVAGLMTGVGFAWWVRNQVVFGEMRTGGLRLGPARPDFEPDPVGWLQLFGSRMSFRFWGHFGWSDVRFPVSVVATAVVVTVVLVVLALLVRRPPLRRSDLLVVLAPLALLAFLVGSGAYERYLSTGLTPGIQGRYLFGGLVGLAVTVGVGATVLLGRRAAWAPVLVVVGGLGLQWFAAVQNLQFYWGAPDGGVSQQLEALGAWSPWVDPLPVAVLAVTVAGALAVVALAVQRARSST